MEMALIQKEHLLTGENVQVLLEERESVNEPEFKSFNSHSVQLESPFLFGKLFELRKQKGIVFKVEASYKSFRHLESQTISKKTFFTIALELVQILKSVKDPENIILDLDYMYIDEVQNQIKLVYLPIINNHVKYNPSEFFKEYLHMFKLQKDEAAFATHYFNYFRSLQHFSLKSFETFLMDLGGMKPKPIVKKVSEVSTSATNNSAEAVSYNVLDVVQTEVKEDLVNVVPNKLPIETPIPTPVQVAAQIPVQAPVRVGVEPSVQTVEQPKATNVNLHNSTSNQNCVACGASLKPNANFCTKCGQKVISAQPKIEKKVSVDVLPVAEVAAPKEPVAPEVQTPVESLRFCTECGSQVNANVNFCTSCGFNFKQQIVATPTAQSTGHVEVNTSKPVEIEFQPSEIATSQNVGVSSISETQPNASVGDYSNIDLNGTTVLGEYEEPEIEGTTILGEIEEYEIKAYIKRQKTDEKVNVAGEEFLIGKDPSRCQYFVDGNSAISRAHAKIQLIEDRYYLVDCNSTNKSYVDGQKMIANQPFEIFNGANIRLANEDFYFILE
jgi:hypothetical protein